MPEQCSVGDALARLLAEGLRSAPVVAAGTAAAPAGGGIPADSMRGFVEAAAVIDELMKGLHEVSWPPSPAELEEAGARLCALPLSQLLRPPPAPAAGVRAPSSCPWPAVDAQASVVDAMGAFVASHAQHLLVTGAGDAKNIVSVVSQSDVVRFLAANLASAPELNHSTLAVLGLAGRALASGCRSHGGGGSGGGATERHSALARSSRLADADPHCTGSGGSAGSCGSNGLGRTQEQHGHGHSSGGGRAVGWRLVTVPESATALDALRVIHAKSVSGVAVVGHSGDLVGHFGASDVRCLAPGVFHQLLAPVRDFLRQVPRPPRGSGAGGGGAAIEAAAAAPGTGPLAGRVLCAQATSSFGQLVAALVRQRVHRIYVTDADCKPVGVVTCTDVLDTLMAHA